MSVASSSIFLPAALTSILLLISVGALLLACCKQWSCAVKLAIYYACEHAGLFSALAVFVVLPAEISKLLREEEIDIGATSVGWAALNHTLPLHMSCSAQCRPGLCNVSTCFGCGFCFASGRAPDCPPFETRQCATGTPELVIDCPGLTASGPLLVVYAVHAALSFIGIVKIGVDLAANDRPFRTHGFYTFAEARRHDKWFQRYIRFLTLVMGAEMIATGILGALIAEDGMKRASRLYELFAVIVVLLIDFRMQWRSGPSPAAPPCPIRLTCPFYTKASDILARADRAYLTLTLTEATSPIDQLLGGPWPEARAALCKALTARLQEDAEVGSAICSADHAGRRPCRRQLVVRWLGGLKASAARSDRKTRSPVEREALSPPRASRQKAGSRWCPPLDESRSGTTLTTTGLHQMTSTQI